MMEELEKARGVLDELKTEMLTFRGDEGKCKQFEELHEIIGQLDFSVLESTESENVPSPSTPKRRKMTRTGSESNEIQLTEKQQKEFDETEKQIKLVKKALNVIYDIESKSFKKFISKNEKKRRNVVSRVPFIKRIYENGQALPLWVGLEDEEAPPLCGSTEADDDYVAEVGDMVAALVKQHKKENWILAEVIAYDQNKKEYKVDDIYEEPKAEQILPMNKVIPLPKFRADPEVNPEALFSKDSQILALYPGTTCFYPAVVREPPVKPEDPYQLLFEDEHCESGYSSPISVHQRYVIYRGGDDDDDDDNDGGGGGDDDDEEEEESDK